MKQARRSFRRSASAAATALACAIPGLPVGVVDLHVDLPYQVEYHRRDADLGRPGGDVTAAGLRAGCVQTLVLSLFVPSGLAQRRPPPEELTALLQTAERLVRENDALHGPGRTVVFSVEDAQALAGHLGLVPGLVRRGVRLFGPVHGYHNDLADSATDPHPGRGGLTPEGDRFVRAVYAAGALVDVSHLSDEAFDDVARLAGEAGRPLVATHSNARAITAHPRNLTDAQLGAVARSDGVVGLNFHSAFLRADGVDATLDDVVRHALHLTRVMGARHVAIGSDLDGEIRPARGLATHAGIPALARAFCAAGIRGAALRGLLGENALRVVSTARP